MQEQCKTDLAPDGTPPFSRGTLQDIPERVLHLHAKKLRDAASIAVFAEVPAPVPEITKARTAGSAVPKSSETLIQVVFAHCPETRR